MRSEGRASRPSSKRGGRRQAPAQPRSRAPLPGLSPHARALLPDLSADFSGADEELCAHFSLRPDQLETLKRELLASGLVRPVVLALPASFGADQLLFTLGRLPRSAPSPAIHQELSRLIAPFPQLLWVAAGPELFFALGAFASPTDLELYVERLEGWLRGAGLGDAYLLHQWRFPLLLSALPHFWDFSSALRAISGAPSAPPTSRELRSAGGDTPGKRLGEEEAAVLVAWMEQPLATPTKLRRAAQLSLRKAQRIQEELIERKLARVILNPELASLALRVCSVVHSRHSERRTLLERLRLQHAAERTEPFLSLERAQQAINCFAYPTLGEAEGQLAARGRLAQRHGLLQEAPSVYHCSTARLREVRPLTLAGACRDAWRRR